MQQVVVQLLIAQKSIEKRAIQRKRLLQSQRRARIQRYMKRKREVFNDDAVYSQWGITINVLTIGSNRRTLRTKIFKGSKHFECLNLKT